MSVDNKSVSFSYVRKTVKMISVYVSDPPTVHVRPESPTVVNETDRTDVLLVCEVIFGNPTELVEVRWYFNGRIMENRNKSLLLKGARKSHHGNYSCSGRSIAGLGPICSPLEVKVQCELRIIFD